MKQFSKKVDLTLLIVLSISFVLTSLLVLFSSSLLIPLQGLFERIFHRTVNLSKWGATIASLMVYPVFLVILVDAILFCFFSDRSKSILILTIFTLTAFYIVYIAYNCGSYYIDSDTSAEMALAKECCKEKSLWPLTWHYSTEIRILQAQLFTAPLLAITKNFAITKALSVLLVSLCIPLSLYFYLAS